MNIFSKFYEFVQVFLPAGCSFLTRGVFLWKYGMESVLPSLELHDGGWAAADAFWSFGLPYSVLFKKVWKVFMFLFIVW